MEIIKKQEIEEQLGRKITARQFEEALRYARQKQWYIYECDRREVVLQHWYLVTLIVEYVRNLAFSQFTMDLCAKLHNMEKEHSVKDQSALKHNHIVA